MGLLGAERVSTTAIPRKILLASHAARHYLLRAKGVQLSAAKANLHLERALVGTNTFWSLLITSHELRRRIPLGIS